MPCTTLDSKTALVVIDFQRGIAAMAGDKEDSRGARERGAARAGVSAREADGDFGERRLLRAGAPDAPPRAIPSDPSFSEILAELAPEASDVRVTKKQPNAFYGTDLGSAASPARRHGHRLVRRLDLDRRRRDGARGLRAELQRHDRVGRVRGSGPRDARGRDETKMFPRVAEIDTTDAILRHLE